jgi:hypothetical protein
LTTITSLVEPSPGSECPNAYGNQDALIQQVAQANPNTVVALETGGPVLTPWRDQVKGLIAAWYLTAISIRVFSRSAVK